MGLCVCVSMYESLSLCVMCVYESLSVCVSMSAAGKGKW